MSGHRYREPADATAEEAATLTPEQERLVAAIVMRTSQHPPMCLVGLDAETVATLKDLAVAYQMGKKRARELFLKLAIWGLFVGALAAVANFDLRGFLRQLLGGGQ